MRHPILIGVGANLESATLGQPIDACRWAFRRVVSISDGAVVRTSSFYRTAPVPASDQPDFINAVFAIDADFEPEPFLQRLHDIEAEAGRVRSTPNAARILDLDLLAMGDLVRPGPGLVLPHPRLADRAFVLYPLCDVAPGWRHPSLGLTASELRDRLPPQRIEQLPDATEDLLLRMPTLT